MCVFMCPFHPASNASEPSQPVEEKRLTKGQAGTAHSQPHRGWGALLLSERQGITAGINPSLLSLGRIEVGCSQRSNVLFEGLLDSVEALSLHHKQLDNTRGCCVEETQCVNQLQGHHCESRQGQREDKERADL